LTEKFRIAVDTDERLVRICVWGFWSTEEALEYRRSLEETMDLLGSAEPWNVIADVRLFPVQPAPVQKIHRELMQLALLRGMDRSANIVGGPLTRIQIEELASTAWPEKGHFEYFLNEGEANSWLRKAESGFA
jgi:hypothetical protein